MDENRNFENEVFPEDGVNEEIKFDSQTSIHSSTKVF